MSLISKITNKLADRVMDLATDKLKEMVTEFIYKAEDYAKTTVNPYDNMIVEAIRLELKIPKRQEEKTEEPAE